MNDTQFNLLDEKWILVRKSDCTVDEVSLIDALLCADEYDDLAGELPTQDVPIMRLLLAVLHTVFSRYSPDGEKRPIENAADALKRWSELWKAGKFPEKPLREYLVSQHEKFWLFHPTNPFYQTNAAEKGTAYTASKLNGEISESSNKLRLFSPYSGADKSRLSYSEAARWLLYVNSYDDTSAKPKGKDLPSPGAGWLGKLGLIFVCEKNLFETLMLNLILLNPQNRSVWSSEKPIWELDTPRSAERSEIPSPDNLSELYTLQSRRIKLIRENEYITGYTLLGGDFFDKTDAFIEPMTIWGQIKENKQSQVKFNPKRHNSSILMWREFPSSFSTSNSAHIPGIVTWMDLLRRSKLIDKKDFIKFKIASIQYGDKDFFVNNVFADSITFHTDILTDLGTRWRNNISKEVSICEKLAYETSSLAKSLELASGSSEETVGKCASVQTARERFYYDIDIPFRDWLASIDPNWGKDTEKERDSLQSWHDTAIGIAESIGENLVKNAGASAFVGRSINDIYYSAPKAYGSFKYKIKKIYEEE